MILKVRLTYDLEEVLLGKNVSFRLALSLILVSLMMIMVFDHREIIFSDILLSTCLEYQKMDIKIKAIKKIFLQ